MARRKSLDRLLAELALPEPEARRRAVERLGFYDFRRKRPTRRQRDQALRAVLARLASDPDDDVRFEAAYILSFWDAGSGRNGLVARALIAVLADEAQSIRVRARAAEDFSTCIPEREGPTRRRALALCLELLGHPDPELRFWCIYALGQMQAREATPRIERIAREDDAMCPYMWGVGEEAADVLTYFATGDWPCRVPGTGKIVD
jgi:hypothetical protein